MSDVVRTRIYLTDASRWEEVGRVHNKFFGDIQPTATIIEVARLVHDDWLVEIEADAVLTD